RRDARRGGDDGRRQELHRRRAADVRVLHHAPRRPCDLVMRYVTTRRTGVFVPSFTAALFDGLAADGGLYVPESIERWSAEEVDALPSMELGAIGTRVMEPFLRGELEPPRLRAIIDDALD